MDLSVNVIKDSNLKNRAIGERLCLRAVLAMYTGCANISPLGKLGCGSEGRLRAEGAGCSQGAQPSDRVASYPMGICSKVFLVRTLQSWRTEPHLPCIMVEEHWQIVTHWFPFSNFTWIHAPSLPMHHTKEIGTVLSWQGKDLHQIGGSLQPMLLLLLRY